MTTKTPTRPVEETTGVIDEAKVRAGTAELLRGMSELAAATAEAVESGDETLSLILTFRLAQECSGFLGAVRRATELAARMAAQPLAPEGKC